MLDSFEGVPEGWFPSSRRLLSLLEAIEEHRDFLLKKTLRSKTINNNNTMVIVEVNCDGVPKYNNAGIQYCEPLAIFVPHCEKECVEVYVLRKDFPCLPHMNATPKGFPLSLCLYLGTKKSVLREWTPQRFLRRIQWWLTATAHNNLHAEDQPLEQLFYTTENQLILPSNFSTEIVKPDMVCHVTSHVTRSDRSSTLILDVAHKTSNSPKTNISVFLINVPIVVHGHVERPPNTLGELEEVMSSRGFDILSTLRERLIEEIGSGLQASAIDHKVVLLLKIPMCRVEGGVEERLEYRAYIFQSDRLKIGVAVNAYIKHENQYFANHLLQMDNNIATSWNSEALYPVEVMFFNNQESFRSQSGLVDSGPNGTIVGAGALGSAMLNIWSRCGWGSWKVIDNDYIKPHNLVRHTACSRQVGRSKVDVVAEIYDAVTRGSKKISTMNVDASDLTASTVEFIGDSQLVVDASAGFEYPRAASKEKKLGRHVSVFISPDGNSSVFLAEDNERNIHLLALEGQYYRAILNSDWGASHLNGNLGSYWSGASCRDISFLLPYSRVLAHAACLAEQVQSLSNNPYATIKVWQRNPLSGAVIVHEVLVSACRKMKYGDFDVYIDQGLEKKLCEMRAAQLPCETGGILLGYYDLSENFLVIVDACAEPSDSISTNTTFQRGTDGVLDNVNEASKRTAGIVGYVGEWHSHPSGISSSLSRDDLYQLSNLAIGMAEDGLPAISLIVAENDIQIYQGKAL